MKTVSMAFVCYYMFKSRNMVVRIAFMSTENLEMIFDEKFAS